MKRCALVTAIAMVIMLLVLYTVNIKAVLIACLLIVAALIFFILIKNETMPVVLGFCLAGAVSLLLFTNFYKINDQAYNGMTMDIKAYVEEVYGNGKYRLKVEEATFEGYSPIIRGDLIYYDNSGTEFKERDILEGKFNLSAYSDNGLFRNNYSDGAFLRAYANDSPVKIGVKKATFFDISYNLRRYIQNVCQKVGGDEGGLLLSVLTGNKNFLSNGVIDAFTKCGLSHIMAVSGMHLSIVAGFILPILDKFEINKKLKYVITAFIVLFIMTAAAFSFSVIRAGVMTFTALLAQIIGRKANSLNSLAASVCVILIINPFALGNVGFVLSVCATYGIVAVMPLLYRFVFKIKNTLIRYFVSIMFVSVSATLGVLPVSAYLFSEFSFVGAALSVAVTIFVSLLLLLGFVFCLIWFIPGLSFCYTWILRFICKAFIWLITLFSKFEFASITFRWQPLIIFAAFLFVFTIVKAAFKRKEVRRGVALICVAVSFTTALCCSIRLVDENLKIGFIGENKNIALYVKEENAFGVIDCVGVQNAREVNKAFKECELENIAIYIMPQYSKERLEALEYFKKEQIIEKLILPDIAHNQKYDIIEMFKDTETQVILHNGGSSFEAGEISVSLYGQNESLIPYIYSKGFGLVFYSENTKPAGSEILPGCNLLICSGNNLSSIKSIRAVSPDELLAYGASNRQLGEFLLETKNLNITKLKGAITVTVNENGRYAVKKEQV